MIDVDRMEAQLSAALTEQVRPAPAPTAAPPRVTRQSRPAPPPPPPVGVRELMELGLVKEADARIAAATDRLEQTTWTTMRALLDGRRDAVRMGVEGLVRLAQDGVSAASEPAWTLRFWAAFEWGTEDERSVVLDHCRERAYRFDDLAWWGNLTVLLAVLHKQDEAVRAFDQALAAAASAPPDGVRLDAVTNLIEAATFLGDAGRVALAGRQLRTETGRLVVVGAGVACKGSVDRYLGLIHAAVGQGPEAAEYFGRAETTHRAIGAEPLLARTLQQARGVLAAA